MATAAALCRPRSSPRSFPRVVLADPGMPECRKESGCSGSLARWRSRDRRGVAVLQGDLLQSPQGAVTGSSFSKQLEPFHFFFYVFGEQGASVRGACVPLQSDVVLAQKNTLGPRAVGWVRAASRAVTQGVGRNRRAATDWVRPERRLTQSPVSPLGSMEGPWALASVLCSVFPSDAPVHNL